VSGSEYKEKKMKTRIIWVTGILVMALTLMTGGAGALDRQTTPTTAAAAAVAAVAAGINYQGRLTDPGGTPLNGTFPMQFQIHSTLTGNSILWDSGIISVDVDHGLFNVKLAVDPTDFDGQALWLRIYVNGEWLSPRQELLPVPYALSLRPGAQIRSTDSGIALQVANSATGSAVRGESANGWGVYGFSENTYAVYGVDGGATQGKGYGGYFTSNTGIGVYGYSSATSVTANTYTPGVYGRSANGIGVLGVSDDEDAGVLGQSDGVGVYGRSEHSHGVRGVAEGPATDQGYGGYFRSDNYRGLYARGDDTYYAGYFENPAGAGHAGLWVDGNLWVTGSKTGYVVDMAINEGPESLETGDVVVVTGFVEPIAGDIPTIKVRKAAEEESTGVVGVVDQPFAVQTDPKDEGKTIAKPITEIASLADDTAIEPGEYLSMVTLGAFKAIKADASYGAIQPGDLLVASSNPGHAMRADDPRVGTVIGKAMGELDKGTGIIPVLVTLH
jgi:hypothetical protein